MTEARHLLMLASRCEASQRPDRELDADIYEALGFTVRRKPTRFASKRTPAGGIYQQGNFWKTLGAVSADIDVAVSLLREKAPDWSWSLQCLVREESLPFQALVAECSGQGVMGSLALCAAMLRALAKSDLVPPGSRKLDQADQGSG
ncbi:hypothetical protein [Bosea sp. (in: a-proteobacteria)]|uniref:hypothetical protein n=1 Tax=Bosea sp. (in: a-proteobacteria) TaxID=1871050 RepID=UPI0012214347|nr:hypothetical protein [Bosea sp. (in: a-proteobacteria)]TAJ31697.1 MAG: hypothetical protein EPO59_07545 [Bosea sp. (in: a-proteobacteria)]